MSDVSTPTVTSLSSLTLSENEQSRRHHRRPHSRSPARGSRRVSATRSSSTLLLSPSNSNPSGDTGIRTSEEERLINDASGSEQKVKILQHELLASLKENKDLLGSQELLHKENERLRKEVANLHAQYTAVSEKSKYFTKSAVHREHHKKTVDELHATIDDLRRVNTSLRTQNDGLASDYNGAKKKLDTKQVELEKATNDRMRLESRVARMSKAQDELVEKTRKAMQHAETREDQHREEIEQLHKRYLNSKDDHTHLQDMCRRLNENAAADRAEIERLRTEKHSVVAAQTTTAEADRNTIATHELLYMPAMTNTQRDMILDVMNAQKRALLRLKHLNIENRDLKSQLQRAKKSSKYAPNRLTGSSGALQHEDGIRVWELLEHEKLQTQRVLSELAQSEQELDNFRVERAMDKLQLHETRNENVLLTGKIKAEAQDTENVTTTTQTFVKSLTEKVCHLERQCQVLKEKEVFQTRKRKLLATKTRPKFAALRNALKKQKRSLDERDAELDRQQEQLDAFRHMEHTLKNKIGLYEKKMERYQGDLVGAQDRINEFEHVIEGKQSTIEELQKVTAKITQEMDLDKIKRTVNDMVGDIRQLRDDTNVPRVPRTRVGARRGSVPVSVSSSTDDLDDSETTLQADTSYTSVHTGRTPSALSRAARQVATAGLNQSELDPIMQRTKRSVVPKRSSHHSQTSVEYRVLKRRIASLTKALQIAKMTREQLEERLDGATKAFYDEKSRSENAHLRERSAVSSLKNSMEKAEKLQFELSKTREDLDRVSAEIDSRWSRKEQEIRENRLRQALDAMKTAKTASLEAEKMKGEMVQENEKLKERLGAANAQIGRQRTICDESRSRLSAEKKKAQEAAGSNDDLQKANEQQVLDISHKKLHIGNLKRQLTMLKDKILGLEDERSALKGDLVSAHAEHAGTQEKLYASKQKCQELERGAEESILTLQRTTEDGIRSLKKTTARAEQNAQEFCLAVISIADSLIVKMAKQRNAKATRYENIASDKLQKLRAEKRASDRKKRLNSRAEELALSILDISTDDLEDILLGPGNTEEIRALQVQAQELRNGLDDDLAWQNLFVVETKSKRNNDLHSFSQVLCKSIVHKIDELCELCS